MYLNVLYIATVVAIHYYSTKKECSCQCKSRLVKTMIVIMIRSSTAEVTQELTTTSELFI